MDDEPMWAADRVVTPTLGSAITIPETTNEFAIKANHLTIVKGNQFDGRTKTNPHKTIHEFLRICDMFKYKDTENEAVRLMIRFFPPALFDRLLEEIRAFSQHENESLTDAWLRMKEMLRNCHNHNLSKGNIIKIFYHGLNKITQEVLNATAGGIFLYKMPYQAYQLLEDKVLLKVDWAKNQKTKSSLKETVAFADEGRSNTDTDKIMARMDAMTMKMDAQYKELQSRAKQPTFDLDDDDIPMSREEEAKFMQTFLAKNHQALIQNLETKFDRLADKQSGRPSRSLPSNTQPNPRGSKAYQPPQARNEHVNAIFTRSGKSYNPPENQNEEQNKTENPINFNSDDEDDEPLPQSKIQTHKPVKETPLPKPYKPKIPYPQRLRKEKNGGSIRKISRHDPSCSNQPENMLVEVGKFTFPTDFVILEMEEDSKVPLILGRPFLHTADAVIRVKQKQLNLGILEEDFDALLDEGSKILHSIEGTLLEKEIFLEFDEFIAMTEDENSESEFDTDEPPFKKITINTDYKIKTSLEEPPTDLELKPLPDNLEYVFLEEPSFLPGIISSQISAQKKINLSYLILSQTIVHTDHSALKHFFKKQLAKPRLIRWILLLQEFDIEIKDKKGTENVVADHLSRIENDKSSDDSEVGNNFPGETLMEINTKDEPWFADFANYLVADIIQKRMTYQQKNKFFSDLKHYFWEEPYLFKVCSDGLIRRYVSGSETRTILDQCHHGPTGEHYGPNITAKKVLDSDFYWTTIIKEAHTLVQLCEACQKTGNILKHDEMPLNNIQVCEIFDIWDIDFIRPFLKSHKFEYILVAVDYVSKWPKAQALPTNDDRVVITFLKKLFCRFGMPKALISDRGTHFCNKIMEKTMKRYEVNHRFSTSYHPQTSGQVENTNKLLKEFLKKLLKIIMLFGQENLMTLYGHFRTAYKTPTSITPYKLIYGKNCHLPFEIEHHAYRALKNCNPDLIVAGEKRMFQLHELDEFRHQAYENS
ncbi:reverse transcriptase domain-containing protein [Tanacetum coccineum]